MSVDKETNSVLAFGFTVADRDKAAQPVVSLAPKSFEEMDVNGDGVIDRAEWEVAFARPLQRKS